jgi:hypothetical protein
MNSPKNAPLLAFVIGLTYRMFAFFVESKPYPFNNNNNRSGGSDPIT